MWEDVGGVDDGQLIGRREVLCPSQASERHLSSARLPRPAPPRQLACFCSMQKCVFFLPPSRLRALTELQKLCGAEPAKPRGPATWSSTARQPPHAAVVHLLQGVDAHDAGPRLVCAAAAASRQLGVVISMPSCLPAPLISRSRGEWGSVASCGGAAGHGVWRLPVFARRGGPGQVGEPHCRQVMETLSSARPVIGPMLLIETAHASTNPSSRPLVLGLSVKKSYFCRPVATPLPRSRRCAARAYCCMASSGAW
jgi:hypothetical protein